jgi:hypothetical protein
VKVKGPKMTHALDGCCACILGKRCFNFGVPYTRQASTPSFVDLKANAKLSFASASKIVMGPLQISILTRLAH